MCYPLCTALECTNTTTEERAACEHQCEEGDPGEACPTCAVLCEAPEEGEVVCEEMECSWLCVPAEECGAAARCVAGACDGSFALVGLPQASDGDDEDDEAAPPKGVSPLLAAVITVVLAALAYACGRIIQARGR